MAILEDLQPPAQISGILPEESVAVISIQWFGSDCLELTYKLTQSGSCTSEMAGATIRFDLCSPGPTKTLRSACFF